MKAFLLLIVVGTVFGQFRSNPQQGNTQHHQMKPKSQSTQNHDSRLAADRKQIPQDKSNVLFNRPEDIAKQGPNFLKGLPPRALGSLNRTTWSHISSGQFGAIISNASKLNQRAFHNMMGGLSDKTFNASLGQLKGMASQFSKEQSRTIVQRFSQQNKKGPSQWSKDDFSKLGDLRKGMTKQQISQISPSVLPSVIGDFKKDYDQLDDCQKRGVVDAKKKQKSPGQFGRDDIDQIGKFAQQMSNKDMSDLPSDTVKMAMKIQFGQQTVSQDKGQTLIKKFQSDPSKLTRSNVDDLGNLNNHHRSHQVKAMNGSTFEGVAERVGGPMGMPNKPTDATMASRHFGMKAGMRNGSVMTDKLKKDDFEKTPKLLGGLSTRELKGLNRTEFGNSLKKAGPFLDGHNKHQMRVLGDKLGEGNGTRLRVGRMSKNLSDVSSMDLKEMGKAIRGLRSMRVGKLNGSEVARAAKDAGIRGSLINGQSSMKRAFVKKAMEGGAKKPSDFGGDLVKHVPLSRFQNMTDKDTVMDQMDRDVNMSDSQRDDGYGRFRKHLGDPAKLAKDNTTQWDADTVRKTGSLLAGASNEDIRNMPFDSKQAVIDTLLMKGSNPAQMKTAVRAHADENGINFTQAETPDIKNYGRAVGHLTLDNLTAMRKGNNWPGIGLQVSCQMRNHMGVKGEHGADKTKQIMDMGRDAFRQSPSSSRTARATPCGSSDEVETLGQLNQGRNDTDIDDLCSEAHRSHGKALSGMFNATQNKRLLMNRLEKLHNGDSGMMSGDDLSDSGASAKHLTVDQIKKLKPKSVCDGLDEMSKVSWSKEQAQALVPHLEHKDCFNKSAQMWRGQEHRRAGKINAGFNASRIDAMKPEVLDEALESFADSADQMTEDQKKSVRMGVAKHMGGGKLDDVKEDDLDRMGKIGQNSDVFKSKHFGETEDVISSFGERKMSKSDAQDAFKQIKSQRSMRSRDDGRRMKRATPRTVGDWTSDEVSNTGHIWCGASTQDVDAVSVEAAGDALPALSKVDFGNCDESTFKRLSGRARKRLSPDQMSDFPVGNWSRAHTSEMGNLITSDDVPKFNRSHIEGIPKDTFRKMRNSTLKAFSPDQFRMVDSDKARVIQERPDYSSLSNEQQEAVDSAASVDTQTAEQTQPTTVKPTIKPTSGATTVFASLSGSLVVLLAKLF